METNKKGLGRTSPIQNESGHHNACNSLGFPKSHSFGEENRHKHTCDCDSCLLGINDTLSDDRKSKVSLMTWSKLRSVMYMTFHNPKRLQSEWTQVGGHIGGFCQGTQSGTILKLLCHTESECLKLLMNDALKPFVPEFHGNISMHQQVYVEMQDLLHGFRSPCLMDCKMGTRTYLEKELVKARIDPLRRHDLYEKMIEVDPTEPTDEELVQKALTKARYMQWRETISSTSTLGFRIEGVKQAAQLFDPNLFKTVKTYDDVKRHLRAFCEHRRDVLQNYVDRLKHLREALEHSAFFASHEVTIFASALQFKPNFRKHYFYYAYTRCALTHVHSKRISQCHTNSSLICMEFDTFANMTKLLADIDCTLIVDCLLQKRVDLPQ